jgi:hypothetical protein
MSRRLTPLLITSLQELKFLYSIFSDSYVRQLCCTCISDLLRNDRAGELSLEIVRLVTRLLKTRSYAVEPCVLDVFVSLNIR